MYIPYFILPEIEPDDQIRIDGMKHFCFLPGTVWAHKVIVQSEKILGLGSPKLDRVKKTEKGSLEIPDEWLKVIEKPDGTWKKIIFYNTSIQDEVALLWRPHPLMQSTVQSMRPQLWAEYEEVVNIYRAEGWGIYDDSADLDRAVVLSDAYYGDRSSVVQVYQETGKPIMIQNVEVV